MKLLLTLLLAICAASGYGQTIKSLGYNTTNGQVIANTGTNGLTFTNIINAPSLNYNNKVVFSAEEDAIFSQNSGAGEVVANWQPDFWTFRVPVTFNTTNIAATTRTNLNLGASWLTNTNVTNFRTAIGLGATNQVQFSTVNASSISANVVEIAQTLFVGDGAGLLFDGEGAGNFRTNLGLPLAALTNTSNVTMMRALSGSTNTNHPFSGSVSVVGTNNTNTLVFSNGILQAVQ